MKFKKWRSQRLIVALILPLVLQQATPRDRIIIYAENGFWYDTLTELIKLCRQNPQDEELKTDWENLLKSDEVKLPNIAREPIVSCCQPK